MTFIVSTGMIALYYGFDRNLLRNNSDKGTRLFLQITSILTIVFSCIGALHGGWLKLKSLVS